MVVLGRGSRRLTGLEGRLLNEDAFGDRCGEVILVAHQSFSIVRLRLV
jgi:hypothetical protein